MAITVLPDVILPNSVLAEGVRGKNLRSNTRAMNQGGYGTININWANTLRQYELGIVPMLVATWQTIEGLYEITEGGAYGFLMEDPKDNSAAGALLQPLLAGAAVGAIGSGYGVATYQLYKRYTSIGTSRTKDRKIGRPKPAPAILRGVTPVVYGAGAGQAALDTTTGIVTFVADASANVTGVAVGASTQVTLASALAGLVVGGRLWLQGLTGTDAALLNNLSHPITGIAGAVYTLGTSTAGKTITAAGQGVKYPQPNETLIWSGGFYVPVNFMNDEIDWDMVRAGQFDQRLLSGPSVVLQEIRE